MSTDRSGHAWPMRGRMSGNRNLEICPIAARNLLRRLRINRRGNSAAKMHLFVAQSPPAAAHLHVRRPTAHHLARAGASRCRRLLECCPQWPPLSGMARHRSRRPRPTSADSLGLALGRGAADIYRAARGRSDPRCRGTGFSRRAARGLSRRAQRRALHEPLSPGDRGAGADVQPAHRLLARRRKRHRRTRGPAAGRGRRASRWAAGRHGLSDRGPAYCPRARHLVECARAKRRCSFPLSCRRAGAAAPAR